MVDDAPRQKLRRSRSRPSGTALPRPRTERKRDRLQLAPARRDRAVSELRLDRLESPADLGLGEDTPADLTGNPVDDGATRRARAVALDPPARVVHALVGTPQMDEVERDATRDERRAELVQVERDALAVREHDRNARPGGVAEEALAAEVGERPECRRAERQALGRRPFDLDRPVDRRGERGHADRREQVWEQPVGQRRDAERNLVELGA